jgi:hypothetical protein
MKRLVLLLALATVAVGIFVGAAFAAQPQDRGVTVCVTSLDGFGPADINALKAQGVNANTIPGTFNLPPGLANQVIDSESGHAGQCQTDGGGDNGGGDNGGGNNGATKNAASHRPANGIFLCYSAFQTQPGVWGESQAKELYAEGYWFPYAIAGNVVGGTNIGRFNLVCNPAFAQSVGDSFVGGDGTVLGHSYARVFGLYPNLG